MEVDTSALTAILDKQTVTPPLSMPPERIGD